MGTIRNNRIFLFVFFAIIAYSITIDSISELTRTLISNNFGEFGRLWFIQVAVILICAVAFFFVLRLTAHKAGKVIGAEVTAARADHQPPLDFLLMGYSPRDRRLSLDEMLNELKVLGADAVAGNSKLYKDAQEQHAYPSKTPEGGGPPIVNRWQQNLRAAWHHRKTLKAIYVLDPDKDEFAELSRYLQAALPHVEMVRISAEAAPGKQFCTYDGAGLAIPSSYENYSYVYEGLRRGLEMVHARVHQEPGASRKKGFWALILGVETEDAADRRTCIDATAGQKVFSIAAAILTLNRPLKFSYVTTFNPGGVFGEVCFYDTRLLLAGTSS